MSDSQASGSEMIELSPRAMTLDAVYKLMTGVIVPRPIAWVSTISTSGIVNLAPFSAYTMLSQDPPYVLFQADSKLREKDTIANIRANGEFVVNAVCMASLDAMHQCSSPLPPETGEADHFGISMSPSRVVGVPRVSQSPVALECRLERMFEIGHEPHVVVIGEVVLFKVDPAIMKDGKIDQVAMDPVGRVGGPYYTGIGPLMYRHPAGQTPIAATGSPDPEI